MIYKLIALLLISTVASEELMIGSANDSTMNNQ